MNILRKLDPALFKLIVAFGLMDLAWGLGILLLPESAYVHQQNQLVGSDVREIIGIFLTLKALATLAACFFSARYQVIQRLMIFGFLLWGSLAILSLVSLISGTGSSIFGLSLFLFMLYCRWLVFSFVPPRETV